jgi:2-hydroxy-3-keto-5-methylthiopentenyl-1-phosphate phosphatase
LAVEGFPDFAYVGDGFSDRCVAALAARVFARDGLAEYLAARDVPFERFVDFHDVAELLEDGVSARRAERSSRNA